ncbi:hypothetical protein [Novosphingobium arvoryzae]|uniref:Uncharacterized protein n=1 Tax=Novosphingobium arvoryzae TaxID=1256514 RepID=A0A918R694_9SPHN|nr:hypothetical protein [Novosphingobium arvoryzae]GGZ86841.1 hypothetical protein GCM10011617_01830 [Novosphingobium arvoryzae]
MPFIAIQLAASIVLILLVSWLALALKLGNDVRLKGEAEARELAQTAVCGFDPVDLALDRAGIGALLRDSQGRVMLLRRHGAQFAARILDSHAFARLDRNFLTVGTGEKTFGQITLDLGDKAQVWAASLRRLGN